MHGFRLFWTSLIALAEAPVQPEVSTSRAGSGRVAAARTLVAPEDLVPAPVLLVVGSEGLLADRAVSAVVAAARAADPATEIEHLDAAAHEPGRLTLAVSPSLFGGAKVVVAEGVENANDAFVAEAGGYLRGPDPEACLILRHSGGLRAKGLLDAARAAGAPEAACQPLTRDDEKVDFAAAEFRRAGRRIAPAALRAIVDAVGSDLRELASACAQLLSDVEPETAIDAAVVERYFGGRVEVTGFGSPTPRSRAGRTTTRLLRHALATGADPVPLVAALAAKVRAMAKVQAAGRGRAADLARRVGMAPWQVERAQRELRGWQDEAWPGRCSPWPRPTPRSRVAGGTRCTQWSVRCSS